MDTERLDGRLRLHLRAALGAEFRIAHAGAAGPAGDGCAQLKCRRKSRRLWQIVQKQALCGAVPVRLQQVVRQPVVRSAEPAQHQFPAGIKWQPELELFRYHSIQIAQVERDGRGRLGDDGKGFGVELHPARAFLGNGAARIEILIVAFEISHGGQVNLLPACR